MRCEQQLGRQEGCENKNHRQQLVLLAGPHLVPLQIECEQVCLVALRLRTLSTAGRQ